MTRYRIVYDPNVRRSSPRFAVQKLLSNGTWFNITYHYTRRRARWIMYSFVKEQQRIDERKPVQVLECSP